MTRGVLFRRWQEGGGVILWRRGTPYVALCNSYDDPVFSEHKTYREAEQWLAKTRRSLALVRDLREAQRRSNRLLRNTHVKPSPKTQ